MDKSAITGGTTVLSDRIVVRITSQPGQTFIDRMIALVETTEFLLVEEVSVEQLADTAQMVSLADETPEGRLIVVLAN